jgi:hypothetical protein
MVKTIVFAVSVLAITLMSLISMLNMLITPQGQIRLHWQAPTHYEDGTQLDRQEIEEYYISWSNLDKSHLGGISVSGHNKSYLITGLNLESYDFFITAKSIYGKESAPAKVRIEVVDKSS